MHALAGGLGVDDRQAMAADLVEIARTDLAFESAALIDDLHQQPTIPVGRAQ